MAGGVGVSQLREQVEANQAAVTVSMKEMETKHDLMEAKQGELDGKLGSIQSSLQALTNTFNTQFDWIKHQLTANPVSSSSLTPPIDPRLKGIPETPLTPAITTDLHPVDSGENS